MKITVKTKEILPIMEVINEFYKLYKDIINHNYNVFFRVYSNNDNKFIMVVNNLDIKIKFELPIEEEIKIDKIYHILEFYGIIKCMSVYEEMVLDFEKNYIKFNTDAEFLLKQVDIDDKEKNEIFSLKELSTSENKEEININESLLDEFKIIKKIIDLKNQHFPNYYFYKDESMIFNLFDIYVKKDNTLININSDVVGFKFLTYLLDKKISENIIHFDVNDKFILKSDKYYVEGKKYKFDNNEKQNFIIKFFNEEFNNSREIKIKLEFYNFINVILNMEKNSCVVFDNGTVRIQSADEELDASFKTDFEGFFIVKTSILSKIFNFMMSTFSNNFNEFKLVFGESNNGKWLKIELPNVTLLTEIIGDLNDIENDDDVFEE